MSLSWVTAIELNADDTITLDIRVDGFEPGAPVEISGYATQTNGAVGTFYDIQQMPSVAGPANMKVENIPAAGTGSFDQALPFSVVARAADVWISTLGTAGIQARAAGASGIKAKWSSPPDGNYSALCSTTDATPLVAGFSFRSVRPVQDTDQNPFPDIPGPLGPLAGLVGKWSGQGFNVIWRPHHGGGSNYFLELNRTNELLEFTQISGPIANRGFLQRDIYMSGLTYLQRISDANVGTAGLHIEPGVWVVVPATTNPNEAPSVVRLASIPHGTAILAQGSAATAANEAPVIPDINITPLEIGSGGPTSKLPEQTLNGPSESRTSGAALNNITQEMVDNPNSVLSLAIAGQQFSATTTLHVSTDDPPVPGGGTANTAFLGGAGNNPNAKAARVDATFWLETIQGDKTPNQLQYSQTVLLNFAGKSWPHVTVGTLHRVD